MIQKMTVTRIKDELSQRIETLLKSHREAPEHNSFVTERMCAFQDILSWIDRQEKIEKAYAQTCFKMEGIKVS